MLKGTKEDVSKAMYEVAEGIKKIADKILNEEYDPKDWVKVNETFGLVTTCLMTQAGDFARKRKDVLELLNKESENTDDSPFGKPAGE